jgi:hypothetical protein
VRVSVAANEAASHLVGLCICTRALQQLLQSFTQLVLVSLPHNVLTDAAAATLLRADVISPPRLPSAQHTGRQSTTP